MKKHSHAYAGSTTCNKGHIHNYGGVTTKAKSGVPHHHHMEGITTYDKEHEHKYSTKTGPAIHLINGLHYHYFETKVTLVDGHIHCIAGFTSAN